MGVGWVNGTARWRCPEGVVIISITDLDMPLPLALVWRRDNTSDCLPICWEVRFVADERPLKKSARHASRSAPTESQNRQNDIPACLLVVEEESGHGAHGLLFD